MSEASALTWTPASLRLLRTLSRGGATLAHLAARVDVTAAEVDRALWALLGRTPEDAALLLYGPAAAPAPIDTPTIQEPPMPAEPVSAPPLGARPSPRPRARGDVVQLKPVSPSIVRHAAQQVRKGVALDELAELFEVDADSLRRGLKAAGVEIAA